MVSFKLISYIDGVYRYEVYPEGNEDYIGIVEFNPETKVVREKIQPKAPYDKFDWVGRAAYGFTDDDGNYRESGYVAWY